MRYVLLIPGWFPSKMNFLAGDFIERHARAASRFFPVKVLFVIKDNSLAPGTIKMEHEKVSEGYEIFTYYYSSAHIIKAIEKFRSVRIQSKCLADGYSKITSIHGKPSLIHAHVLVKHAWFALLRSKKENIPLLASEQWTGYLQSAEHEFKALSLFQKRYIRKVFAYAAHVTTVSDFLAKQIRKRFSFEHYTIVPNLVDTTVFQPVEKQITPVKKFIHISTLSYQKNFDEIVEACEKLKKLTRNFHLTVVAPPNPVYQEKVNRSCLVEHI